MSEFTELRVKNQALESIRASFAKIGATTGLRLFSVDTAASASHIVADAESIAVCVGPVVDPDPLHARARAAIERLELDGANLELAVAVFGWGSDEASGSLLGLLRAPDAWGFKGLRAVWDANMCEWHVEYNWVGTWVGPPSATECEALVDAVEKVPR